MTEKNLTREQLEKILSQMKTKQASSNISTPEQQLQERLAMGRLKDLMMEFDKKYMEGLFEEGLKANVFGAQVNLTLQYEYNRHLYILKRIPMWNVVK